MIKKVRIFILFLAFMGCSSPEGGGNNDIPDAPVIVEKVAGADTARIERGIDAVAGSENAIQIMWYAHPQVSELEGFKVYKSDDPAGQVNYNSIATIEIDNVFDQDTVFNDPLTTNDIGLKKFYYVTAVNKDNNESLPSDTVSYTLLHKAVLNNDVQIDYGNPPNFTFNFQVPSMETPNEYILRIEESLDGAFWDLVLTRVWSDFNYQDVSYTLSGNNLKDIFKDNWSYRWRIDFVIDPQVNGSESDWASLDINWGNE